MVFNPVLTPGRLGKNNGWDCAPAPIIAATIESNKARRARILGQLRQVLAHRTIGSDERVLRRAERIAALIGEHNTLVSSTLRLELL